MVSSKDLDITAASAILSTGIPEGSYKLIGWEIDATGQSFVDEICQIGTFTQNSTFSQCILPHEDINTFAQRRYNLRVITVSTYRVLKNLKTNQILETRAEVSVLNDFVSWLEDNRGFLTDGIILVYHEVKKISPLIMLNALKRHGLYARFAAVVKGFCNLYPVAKSKCPFTMKTDSLMVLTRNLLHADDDFKSALDRAKACFGIILHLGRYERQRFPFDRTLDVTVHESYAIDLARRFARSTESEENDLMELKSFIDRQSTFRPVLKEIMKFDWISRQNAIRIRRKLVEHNLDLNNLKTAWNRGGTQGLQLLLKKVTTATPQEQADMLTIFDSYFDPNKESVAGNYFRLRRQRANVRLINNNERGPNSGSRLTSHSGGSAESSTSSRSVQR